MLEILKTDGSTVVLKLNIDRATMANVENFKASLDGIVSQYKKVIIDLSAVNFIDSVFLGSFVVLLKRLSVNNGELKLVGLQPSVRKLFELTRMDKIIQIVETQEEALK